MDFYFKKILFLLPFKRELNKLFLKLQSHACPHRSGSGSFFLQQLTRRQRLRFSSFPGGSVVRVSLVSEIDVIAGSRKPGDRGTGHDAECERTFISICARRRFAKRIRES